MNFEARTELMVGSDQGGLEAETAWSDAAKSSLPDNEDQLGSSELAAALERELAPSKSDDAEMSRQRRR